MSQHYRCDVCGEEMDTPSSGVREAVWMSGARATVSVKVSISPPSVADSGAPLHLCSLCFRKSVARVIQATLLTPDVWTALEGGEG